MEDQKKIIPPQNTIHAIVSALSNEEEDLLSLKGEENVIGVEDLLIVAYGDKYDAYNPFQARIRARLIIDNNKFNFEKLKQQEELIELLKKPESFYEINEKEDRSDKNTGVIASMDSESESLSATSAKGRDGTSQTSYEYDLERKGLEEDQNVLNSVMNSKKRISDRLDYKFREDGELELKEKTEEKPKEETQRQPEKPNLKLAENTNEDFDEDSSLPLSSVGINNNFSVAVTGGNTYVKSGRKIRSFKNNNEKSARYRKSDVIDRLQKMQTLNIRERIISQFSCLFRDSICQ